MEKTKKDHQEFCLRQFAALQFGESPDNLGTMHPFHVVQSRDDVMIPHRHICEVNDAEDMEYVDCRDAYQAYATPEELLTAILLEESYVPGTPEWDEFVAEYNEDNYTQIVTYAEAYENGIPDRTEIICDEGDYFRVYGLGEEDVLYAERVVRYRDMSLHFTLKEAKRYMNYQRHNLTKPRTYTYGAGYADNGDYVPLWEYLMAQGKALLDEESKCIQIEGASQLETRFGSTNPAFFADGEVLLAIEARTDGCGGKEIHGIRAADESGAVSLTVQIRARGTWTGSMDGKEYTSANVDEYPPELVEYLIDPLKNRLLFDKRDYTSIEAILLIDGKVAASSLWTSRCEDLRKLSVNHERQIELINYLRYSILLGSYCQFGAGVDSDVAVLTTG